MKQKLLLLSFLGAAIIAIPSAAAYSPQTRGQCSPFNEWGCEFEYRDNDYNKWTDDYRRGGVRTNYFSPLFEQNRRDYGYNRRNRYDDRRHSNYRRNSYNRHSNYNSYNHRRGYGIGDLFRRNRIDNPATWSEGFVKGEGFGDEYIGDADQINEEIPSWPY